MTADKLEQYGALLDEIADLDKRLRRAHKRAGTVVSDTVRASSAAWPYCMRTVRISGVAEKHVRSVRRIDQLRRRRRAAAQALLDEIEAWLASVDDARIRRMIDLRYIQRLTWRQVARRVYGSAAQEDAVRKRVNRYLDR